MPPPWRTLREGMRMAPSARRRLLAAVVLTGLIAAACSSDDTTTPVDTTSVAPPTSIEATTTTAVPPTTSVATTTEPTTTVPDETGPVPGCHLDDAAACLLPWPDDRFTVADADTPTGRRLALPSGSLTNTDGTPVDLTDQNRADGFSPASAILAFVPGVDLEASGAAPSTNIGASIGDDAPIHLTNLTTGERWPYWAELDATAPEGQQLLIVRPAVALTESHEYQVDLLDLRDADGAPVSMALPLRWSFTVASADSLSGRLRSMVDAHADLVPEFSVTSVNSDGDPRIVEGTYRIPNYLDNDGATGGRFVLDDDGLPAVNEAQPMATVAFTCLVGGTPGPKPTVVYGHGLLGNRSEVLGLSTISEVGGLNACATDWIGMASEDLVTVGTNLADLSGFPTQADRMQQGHLAFVLLGRLVNQAEGFAAHEAFQSPDSASLLAEDGAVFVGLSQGGILGGATSAVTNEWDRALLGVPGIGYNLLLQRSSNWPRFQVLYDEAYPDPVDRLIGLELIQLLWDRGENSGYAQHLTADPYPGITPTTVLLIQAFGDHQVANVSTEILARTIGAAVAKPALEAGRSLDVEPFWGVEELDGFPTERSVLSVWDFGTPTSPPVNLAPFPPDFGRDPHGAANDEVNVLLQALTFLTSGVVIDACDGGPCVGRRIDD